MFELAAIAAIFGLIALLFWLPDYPAPELPADWDPECPQFEGEWTTIELAGSGSAAQKVIRVGEALEGVWLVEHTHDQTANRWSRQFHRLSSHDWSKLAASPNLQAWWICTLFEEQALLVALQDSWTEFGRFLWIEWDRMEIQREIRIPRHAEAQPPGGQLVAFAPHPDGSFSGIIALQARMVGIDSYWFRVTASGELQSPLVTLLADHSWENSGSRAPLQFVGTHLGEPSVVIDPLTGQSLPEEAWGPETRKRIEFKDLDHLIPLRSGRVRIPEFAPRSQHLTIQPIRSAPAMLHPYVLDGQSLSERATHEFHSIRWMYWMWRWGYEKVGQAQNRATTIDALVLRDPARPDDSIILEPSLGESLRPLTELIPVAHSASSGTWILDSNLGRRFGLTVTDLNSEMACIAQFLPLPPARLAENSSLWRIGVIDRRNGEIRWLGWLPLTVPWYPKELPIVEFARSGDQLLVWCESLRIVHRSGSISTHRDFHGITLPLPPELADLPAGWPRD